MTWLKDVTLRSAINGLEDAIITVSGPALAISGIIAGVDLVTGGHILANSPQLSLAWAICLLLTLDFQVLCLGARAHHLYESQAPNVRKAVEITAAVLIAASISYVSVQMQAIIARSNGASISIGQATAQLGINPIALTWERSALVLVLIFMSGWFRNQAQPAQSDQVQAPIVPAIDMEAVIDELDRRSQARIEALMQSMTQTVTRIAIEQITTSDLGVPATNAHAGASDRRGEARAAGAVPWRACEQWNEKQR